MLLKIKNWWKSERINRVEKDTSQDMCPRNGDAVIMGLLFSSPILIYVVIHCIFGVSW